MTPGYPELSSLSVEYNLTEHCNLSCYHCDHASPLLPRKFADVRAFVRDVEALAAVFHSQQFRIAGGEPLLHPDLPIFLRELRRIGISDSIILVTNGTRLHSAPDDMWDLIDQLWVSVYSGVKTKLEHSEIKRTARAKGKVLRLHRVHAFNLTVLNQPVVDPTLRSAVFRSCHNAHRTCCHTIHEGRFFKCSIAPFQEQRLARLGIEFENREVDGVDLHAPELRTRLGGHLRSQLPLKACEYCLGTSGPRVAHRQVNRSGIAAWLGEDHRTDIADTQLRLAYGAIFQAAAERFSREHGVEFNARKRSPAAWRKVGRRIAGEEFDRLLERYPRCGDGVKAQQRELLLRQMGVFVTLYWNNGQPRRP